MHIGSTISHYRIVAKLGEGGMGVVYKAEDTKLERTVALKFLAQHLLNDEEAKARFLREAKAAAALHHSNVCPVYEIDEVDGNTFLAMAYLQGETLEQQIAKGPADIRDALDIGRQVADGLEAAHEAGIVHRDIKPANILVDAKGHATIMDFGLARLTEASRLTKMDTAMGTVAYMSPEQAQGMDVDSRSDIWSLGCVIYEMVSGQRPFRGVYDQALLYEIVHEEVAPLTSIRAGVPMELEFIVGKCLAKDRKDRTATAQEVGRELRTLSDKLKSGRSTVLRTAGGVPAPMTAAHTLSPTATLPPDSVVVGKRRLQATHALVAVATLAFLGVTAIHLSESSASAPTRRFSFSPEGLSSASISPDGRYIAFMVGTAPESSLWLRAMGTETAREIPGTEDVRPGFGWAPDSQEIVFGTNAEIKRISINGGEPITLVPIGRFFEGASWSPDGERIVFASTARLFEIPARGGEPRMLLERDTRVVAARPYFLPAGNGPNALVYQQNAEPVSELVVLNLDTGEQNEIGPGSAPVYSPDGYLIYGAGDAGGVGLFALPFSLSTLKPTGESFPVAGGGQSASVARDGTLVFLDGIVGGTQNALVWRSRTGELLQTMSQSQEDMQFPALSPDGRRIAVNSSESGNMDIWVHDLVRSTKTRLTFDDRNEAYSAWAPSGEEIAYSATGRGLMVTRADGTAEGAVLVEQQAARGNLAPSDWSPDRRYLVYTWVNPSTDSLDFGYVEFGRDGQVSEPKAFANAPTAEGGAKFSPDGRFVAYNSSESGRPEVYVRPFPEGPGKWQVSLNGGRQVRWSRDGKELYYVEGTTLMAVTVSTEPGVTMGQPQPLFSSTDLVSSTGANYDVSPDGQRFITIAPVEGENAAPPTIRIVENWYEEFRGREQ